MIKIKIGFFDSGIGGLSVLHRGMKLLPSEEFIFFADEDHVPYGTKTREEVLQLVDSAFEFLTSRKVKAIVVACNTATSVAVRAMREKYSVPIIGMEPAVKKALEMTSKKILVIATPITVRGEKMRQLLDRFDADNRAELLALPRLVDFAERLEFDSISVKKYLQENFSSYDFKKFGALVLGCTHFNYFKNLYREMLPSNVKIIDGNDGTIHELIRQLGNNVTMSSNLSVEYYFSARPVTDSKNLHRIENFLQRLDYVENIE